MKSMAQLRIFSSSSKSSWLTKCDLISSRENEILNHNEEHNVFFDHLVSLVAESIAQIPVSGEFMTEILKSENLRRKSCTNNKKIEKKTIFSFTIEVADFDGSGGHHHSLHHQALWEPKCTNNSTEGTEIALWSRRRPWKRPSVRVAQVHEISRNI